MIRRLALFLPIAACSMVLVAGSSNAAIGTLNKQLFSGTGTQSYDASGADKLVVLFATESGFNNQQVTSVTMNYNGVAMDLAVENTDWNTTSDGGYAGIFYMDNPFQGTADITWSATTSGGGPNGALYTVLGLTNTLDGIGNIGSTLGDATSLTTIGSGSLLLAAHNNAGNNSAAGTPTPDSPLNLIHNGFWGSQWSSFASGEQDVATSGTLVNPSFTSNANGGNHHTVAAEFLAVPEPSSLALIAIGALGLVYRRRS